MTAVLVCGYLVSNIAMFHAQRVNERSNEMPAFSVNSHYGSFQYNVSNLNITNDQFINNLSQWLKTDNNHTFKKVNSSKDELNFTHSLYEHYYKGVKVMDDMVKTHEKMVN